jgi:putative PIN family toxin of toxin-antitoxin system
MEIMLDTNILISAALFPGPKMTELLNRISINNRIVLCSYVLNELFEVVRRKFPDRQRIIEIFLQKLPYTLVHTPLFDLIEIDITIRDAADYPILMSAILSDVDILITGDHDFKNIEIDKPDILNPSEFLEKYV